MSFAKTLSPTAKVLGLLSMINFLCLSSSLLEVSGCNKSKVVRNLLPIRSWAGERPVVVCGVTLYLNRNCVRRCSMGPYSLETVDLKVCTALSASPLEEGWYGEVQIC